MTGRPPAGWVDLSGRRGVALPAAPAGAAPVVVPDELRQTVVFVDRTATASPEQALAGAGLAPAGTTTGGARGALVLWGPGVLACRVEPARGAATSNWRAVVHGHTPVSFTVWTAEGEIVGAWTQPGVRPGLAGLLGGWSRSAKAVHATVAGRRLVLRAQGATGWAITRADGSASARGSAGRWLVAADADVLERSIALFTAYSVARSSLLVVGGEV